MLRNSIWSLGSLLGFQNTNQMFVLVRNTTVVDHEALSFVYHPLHSFVIPSVAMVRKSSIILGSHSCGILHHSAKYI